MKNRINRYNNGFIGNNNSSKRIGDGVINLNKRNSIISENYNLSGSTLIFFNRPQEWRSLPSFSGITQGFAGVFGVYDNDTNYVTFQMDTTTGNYTIDWGDGTTGSGTDNQILYKRYTRDTYAGLTSVVYNNYKTLLIQAYPVSGRVSGIVLTNDHNQSGFVSGYRYPWLDIQIVGSSCSNVSLTNLFFLEQVNFIGSNSITTNSSRFAGCRNLKKIINWDTSKCTTFHQMFRFCTSLPEIPPIDTTSAAVGTNNFTYMFDGCFSLRYVPLFDTSKATSFDQMFSNCFSLTTIPSFNTSNVTSMLSAFYGCSSLEELPWLDTSKVTNFGSAIRGCPIKKFVWNTTSFTNMSYCFGNLYRLLEIDTLNTPNVTDHFELFARSYSLVKAPDTINLTKSTRFNSAFYECFSLKKVPTLIRDGSVVCDFSTICYNNEKLEEFPSFNTAKISSWSSAFINNYCLSSVGFTFNYPVGQTWATSTVFNSTFQNCQSLRSIGISDVSGISGSTYATAYANMFNNCLSLNEVGLSGISENFSIQNCALGATALNDLYTRLAVVGISGAGAKTITVSGNWGAANDNPAIAIAKGWTVTG